MNVSDCPKINLSKLKEELRATICINHNYIFYRIIDTRDGRYCEEYPAIEMKNERYYQVYCTACTQHYEVKIGRHSPFTASTECTKCWTSVKTKRYIEDRKYTPKMNYRFLYTQFSKGADGSVWFRTFECEYDFSGTPGYEELNLTEVYRFYFNTNEARKFEYRQFYVNGRWEYLWQEMKTTTEPKWQINQNFGAGQYERHYSEVDTANTCIKYSQLDIALENNLSMLEYLVYYTKNPSIEYLWKMGHDRWIRDRFNGFKAEFLTIVNPKAKTFKKLIKNLNKIEITLLQSYSILTACTYLQLKDAGVLNSSDKYAVLFADSVSNYDKFFEMKSKVDLRVFFKYLCRQKDRTNNSFGDVIRDYFDYIRQLEELGVQNLNYLPDNLHEEHRRLSHRLRKTASRDNLQKFRNRRHQLKYTKFSYKGLIIRPIDSPFELVLEGEQQENCVADYEKRHSNAETAVLVIRSKSDSKKPLYTVEYSEKTNKILQCRGFHNRKLDNNTENLKDEFIEKWLEIVKQRCKKGA